MSKLNLLEGIKIGAMLGDEMHYGGRTANYQNLKEKFQPYLDLAVTATPTKYLLKQYNNRYAFTEYDRQLKKHNGDIDYRDAVTPVQFTVKFDDIFSSVDTKWGEEKVTNMSGVVLSDDTQNIKDLISLIWLDPKYRGVDKDAHQNTFNINNMVHNIDTEEYSFTNIELNHGIAILPMNSKKIINFVKIANAMQDEYLFIATTQGKITDGKHTLGESLPQVIKEFDKKGKKTVTCTCYMFIEGVTVPEWNYIVWLDNNKSTSKYFQGNGRGLSQNEDYSKQYSFIFDFDWNRCLILNDEMMHTAMVNKNICDVDKFFTEYGVHSNPIFLYTNGKYQQIDSTTEYHELLAEATKGADRVEYIIDEFEDEEILENEDILMALIAQDKKLRMDLGTDKNKLDKFSESAKKVAKKKQNGEKLDNDEKKIMATIEELKNKLRAIINCIPELAFCTEENTIEDIIDHRMMHSDIIMEVLNITSVELSTLFYGHDFSKINTLISNMYSDFDKMNRYDFEAKWLAQYTMNEKENQSEIDVEVIRNLIDYQALGISF